MGAITGVALLTGAGFPGTNISSVTNVLGLPAATVISALAGSGSGPQGDIFTMTDGASGDSRQPPSPSQAGPDSTESTATAATAFPAISRSTSCATSREPYPDVHVSNPACDNILWLDGLAITKPADGYYHPRASVTRGAMAAFLFRLTNLGSAGPTCTSRPFADVPISSTFCGYIKWAKNNGIAYGYSGDTYGTARAVTRGAMAAYLYRIANPGIAAPNCRTAPYADVDVTDTFCGVITWMKSHHITYGVGDDRYGTALPVTRQAMASFLHRISDYILAAGVTPRGGATVTAMQRTLQSYVPDGGEALVRLMYTVPCFSSPPGSGQGMGCVSSDAPSLIRVALGSGFTAGSTARSLVLHEFSHVLQFRWMYMKPAARKRTLDEIGWEPVADCMAFQMGATVGGYVTPSDCTGAIETLALDILNWRDYP
jgi:hypothetical protein